MDCGSSENFQLTPKQRNIIEYELSQGKTPKEIIESWSVSFHHRKAPSEQAIYSIKRQIMNNDSVEPKKRGPKSRSVLTEEKLDEIEKVIRSNDRMTFQDLSIKVGISYGTAVTGSKLVGFEKYDAQLEENLTESQMSKRLTFCSSFLKWNYTYRKAVWWSDESSFSIDSISRYCPKSYFAQGNEHRKIQKQFRKKSFNVWAAIRGDGSLLYEIMEGNQTSENYIQLLFNMFPYMDPKTSFLMQDGAGIHTSNDALEWIDFLWKDRWIGLFSKRLEFPPYSMDLTPLDFSFWSYIKRKVSIHHPATTGELVEKIHIEMKLVPKDVIINMCRAVDERCQKCMKAKGGRFET